MTLSLADKVVAIHRALPRVPHAFGGALALAYYAEPRATIDIDLNVFVAPERAARVVDPLKKLGVAFGEDADDLIARDGQLRAFFGANPVDLFFAYDEFHESAASARRTVPFADTTISILDADHLAVCKVVFNRAKDWVDIDAMRAAGTSLDAATILRWVGRVAGDDDPRYERIAAVLTSR